MMLVGQLRAMLGAIYYFLFGQKNIAFEGEAKHRIAINDQQITVKL